MCWNRVKDDTGLSHLVFSQEQCCIKYCWYDNFLHFQAHNVTSKNFSVVMVAVWLNSNNIRKCKEQFDRVVLLARIREDWYLFLNLSTNCLHKNELHFFFFFVILVLCGCFIWYDGKRKNVGYVPEFKLCRETDGGFFFYRCFVWLPLISSILANHFF